MVISLICMCAALIQIITCKSGLVSYFAFHLYEAAAEERMGEWECGWTVSALHQHRPYQHTLSLSQDQAVNFSVNI